MSNPNININVSGPQQPASIYKTKVLKGQVPFAVQVTEPNTKYVIKHNFVLNGDVTIPENCILEFDGGSISGAYTITGQNTGIEAELVKIFNTDVTLAGSWNVADAYPEWFGAKGDGITDDATAIQHSVDFIESQRGGTIRFVAKSYRINSTIEINKNNTGVVVRLLGHGRRVNKSPYTENSGIVAYCTTTIKVYTPYTALTIDGVNFSCDLSRSTKSVCIAVEGTTGYFARPVFKNFSIRNYCYGLNLYGGKENGYVDGALIQNVMFSTVNRCIIAKHFEASHIDCCQAEPFIDYFLYTIQSQTLEVSNCILRGISTEKAAEVKSVGIIANGTNNYGKNLNIHDLVCEDIDTILINSTPFTTLKNVRYINSQQPRLDAVVIGKIGTSPFNCIFENIVTTYEVETSYKDIKFYTTAETINIAPNYENGVLVDYDVNLSLNAASVKGIIINNWDCDADYPDSTTSGQSTVIKIWQGVITWFKKLKVYLNGVDESDESIFSNGDIIINPAKGNIDNYIGKIKTQRFGLVPFGQPILAVTNNQQNAYSAQTVGLPIFNKNSERPLWWVNSRWQQANGLVADTKLYGTFAERPTTTDNNIKVGFCYFCTDKQTAEGGTDGIPIFYKNAGVWVDALGRVVS